MKCKKHQGSDIPCSNCMMDEYNLYKTIPGHDLTQLQDELKRRGFI